MNMLFLIHMEKLKSLFYNTLHWSEKYTKTDMVYLTTGGFWVVLSQIVAAASSFCLSLAFANLLPKEVYGTYRFIISVFSVLTISTLAGMSVAVTRAVAQGNEGSYALAVKTKMKWGLLGSLASLGLGGYYLIYHNPLLASAFFLVAFFLPVMDPFNLYDAFLSGRKLFKFSAFYNSLDQIFATACLVGTMFLTKNVLIIIVVFFASWTVGNFTIYRIILKKFKPNKLVDQDTISYGKHLSVMQIINSIASYFDVLLVFHYLGAAQLAIYSFAIAPPEQLKGLLKTLESLLLPKFSQRTNEEIKATLMEKIIKFGLVIAVMTAFYILIAPFAFKLFYPQYAASVFYSQIFAISLIAAVGILPRVNLESQAAKRELYIYNTLSPIIQIALLFFMIYFYGLLGAILARVIGRFINTLVVVFLAKKT